MSRLSKPQSPDEQIYHPISRRHLHDELVARLRDCIISGELRPGTKIPEKELCEKFGVSRTPLREALKVLAYEGMVVLNHNRGAAVSPLAREDLEQAFPIFARLEGLAGELACANLTAEEMAGIRQQHDEMLAHYRRDDYQGHFAANERVHTAIQQGSKNRNLIQLLQRLSSRVARARAQLSPTPEQWARAVAEHEAIMAALEARDGELTAMLLRQHIENIFRSIAETFPPSAEEPDGEAR